MTFVIGYNFAMIIVWMTSRFSRCFGRNYLLENEVPTKFQILSHPANENDHQFLKDGLDDHQKGEREECDIC